ncbi:DUF1783-domain-containing protein [Rhizodiscina lignyota]|uniref:DUF1783-domain-containing protein n=1 Tax=Rhizodiscina lignyota TaxID=1504668 RepID=A0A9P4IMF1_9PEZI|nr:DUF1783-domain-containing protein [Rhizodiscina lignyota]
MARRSDRELPDIASANRWMRTIPIFLLVLGASTAAIFNYQKLNSSVVSSTLYALRTNPTARELLGDEIYFASKVPWIWGSINQLHGKIDIQFSVKGTKAKAMMKFKSHRRTRMGFFETEDWSLTLDDGEMVQLLEGNQADPFLVMAEEEKRAKMVK